MAYKGLRFKITGVTPLLMHNGQLADPLNDIARAVKKISGKRNKTDDDHAEMARLEWYGGLYLQGGKPCIPGTLIEAAMVESAKRNKRGKQALAGIIAPNNAPLEYHGPKDIDKLWDDTNYRLTVGVRVKATGGRIMRTRPRFEKWSATVEIMYDPQVMNESDVVDTLTLAGDSIGIGDWRPKFGRFTVERLGR